MHHVPSFVPDHPARPLSVLMDLDDIELLSEAAALVRPGATELTGYLHPGSNASGVACLLVGLELLVTDLEDAPAACHSLPQEAGCAPCSWERGVLLSRIGALLDRQRVRLAALLAIACAGAA